MSVNKHPTKPGWFQVRNRPGGRKSKEIVIVIEGEEEAHLVDQQIKASAPAQKRCNVFPTISDKIPEYIKYYSLEHLDTTNVTRSLRRWARSIGNERFATIVATHIEIYKHERLAAGIKPVTINKEMTALSGLLKWGARKGYCPPPTFIERFTAKKTKSPLPDVPTRAEVLALINSMIWPKCGLFACLYYAGLRASEAKNLKAEDIYLDRHIMIVTGKGNKQRPVPVVNELVPVLEKRLREISSGLMWTTRNGKRIDDLDKVIEWARRRAGITRRMYPHLLRHAFGTHSTMAGVNLRSLQYAMGHTSSATTEIYTTLGNSAIIEEITGKFGKG